MKPNKVCPIILRKKESQTEILVFRHPTAGIQLVKGTIEPDENPLNAAIRELAEESGILEISHIEDKGIWDAGEDSQIWNFYLCRIDKELEETWEFFAEEDGGTNFRFFWFDLENEPGDEWPPKYQRALDYIRENFLK